jgi:hypothetical protein
MCFSPRRKERKGISYLANLATLRDNYIENAKKQRDKIKKIEII